MPKRLLIVECDGTLAALAAEAAGGDGWTVDTASNPDEAMDRIGAQPPDVILCAAEFDGHDGFDFAASVRTRQGLGMAGIIVAAGDGADDRAAGDDHLYLLKLPTTPEVLGSALDSAFRGDAELAFQHEFEDAFVDLVAGHGEALGTSTAAQPATDVPDGGNDDVASTDAPAGQDEEWGSGGFEETEDFDFSVDGFADEGEPEAGLQVDDEWDGELSDANFISDEEPAPAVVEEVEPGDVSVDAFGAGLGLSAESTEAEESQSGEPSTDMSPAFGEDEVPASEAGELPDGEVDGETETGGPGIEGGLDEGDTLELEIGFAVSEDDAGEGEDDGFEVDFDDGTELEAEIESFSLEEDTSPDGVVMAGQELEGEEYEELEIIEVMELDEVEFDGDESTLEVIELEEYQIVEVVEEDESEVDLDAGSDAYGEVEALELDDMGLEEDGLTEEAAGLDLGDSFEADLEAEAGIDLEIEEAVEPAAAGDEESVTVELAGEEGMDFGDHLTMDAEEEDEGERHDQAGQEPAATAEELAEPEGFGLFEEAAEPAIAESAGADGRADDFAAFEADIFGDAPSAAEPEAAEELDGFDFVTLESIATAGEDAMPDPAPHVEEDHHDFSFDAFEEQAAPAPVAQPVAVELESEFDFDLLESGLHGGAGEAGLEAEEFDFEEFELDAAVPAAGEPDYKSAATKLRAEVLDEAELDGEVAALLDPARIEALIRQKTDEIARELASAMVQKR